MSEYGYGPLPGIGARDPEPAEDDDAPRCEWCDLAVPDGDSDYPPFCSADCEQAANSETYSSVHPRPEEV